MNSNIPRFWQKRSLFFKNFPCAALCFFSIFFLLSCASTQTKKVVRNPGGPTYSGDGGSAIHLAVQKTEGIELTPNELWSLAYIQNILCNDFSKYSAMTVINRGDAKTAQDRATHLLTSSLRKTSAAEYLFRLNITEIKSGVQKAAYSKQILALNLRSASAIQEAAQDLLVKMGVELTETGRDLLLNIDPDEREGVVKLAKGLAAESSGNTIESLSYMYSAVSYDSSLTEAASKAEALTADLSVGGLGDMLQNDIDARNFWKKLMDEFEAFYTQHPPFELVFTPNPKPKGNPNYEAAGGATADLKFNVGFRETSDLDGMRKVLKLIMSGLDRTGRKEAWGFADWPYDTRLFDGFKKFTFKAELVNDYNTVLKTISFDMPERLFVYRQRILPDSRQKEEIVLSRIKVSDLTSTPMVRIVSVNGIDAVQSGNDGFIKIEPVEKMPGAYPRSLLVFLTRDTFNLR